MFYILKRNRSRACYKVFYFLFGKLMISRYLTFYTTHLTNKKFRYSKWPKIYHIILFIFIVFFITKNQLFIFSIKSLIDKLVYDQSLYNILMVFLFFFLGFSFLITNQALFSQIQLGKMNLLEMNILKLYQHITGPI